ncbi:MBL fold metallo-hydrolase [Janthinobacterium agaricidamnosum]|uniref:Metallo-beta-lactamase superfamily protein n=1 Tax=Janthinobacterium agaricidamnosum NBRC 102515 = DSM 9628 TaxID=1349767 RepID=W0V920_9BURK|nr:MBL fold metallo-hydrolase [Janthinobacterium agaricidamnosum]CDG85324.1 metallo-beta-lactamase superfamily protein [Janthinobacterium agaricidamnosum NBRC 102515 = DSM 9628]
MKRREMMKLASLAMVPLLPGLARAAVDSQPSMLQYKVMTVKRPGLNRDVPPGKESLNWVANSSTLIYGRRDAVLVDTFLTIEQSHGLADAIIASGKTLKTIYITHAHGDHFFGLKILQDRFPDVQALATPVVAEKMTSQITPDKLNSRWRKLFPNQIPDIISTADAMQGDHFELEGNPLIPISVGHTDTDDSTCLHVPSIGLLLAGDAVYNGIHPFLNESNRQTRLEWIAALDRIDALKPRAVVAGHKIPENDDNPEIVAETRQYLRDFIRLNDSTGTARALYDQMLALYPERANPGSLWSAANTAKSQA